MNPQTNELNEAKIYDATREAMSDLLHKEALQAEWLGSIHFNTQHLHVHVGMVEKEPTREWIFYEDKMNPENTGWQYKGKFKIRHINSAKSRFVNHLLAMQDELFLVDYEMKKLIAVGKQNLPGLLQDIFSQKVFVLHEKLPKNKSRWTYGYSQGLKFKRELDELITFYLSSYAKEEFQQFISVLKPISQTYEEAYGNPKNKPTYLENKIYGKSGLYASMGNLILHELKKLNPVEEQTNPSARFSLEDLQQLELEQQCVTSKLPSSEELFSDDSNEEYDYYLSNLLEQEPLINGATDSHSDDYDSLQDFFELPTENPAISDAVAYLYERFEKMNQKQRPIKERIANYEENLKAIEKRKFQKLKENTQQSNQQMNSSTPNKDHLSSKTDQYFSDKPVSGNEKIKKENSKKKPVLYEEGAKNITSFSKQNQEDILTQFPSATFVFGYNQWRLSGRQVKDSERDHPITILAPVFSEESGVKKIVNFVSVPMFDISQTEELTDHFIYANQDGVTIYSNKRNSGLAGYKKIKEFDLEKFEKQVHQVMKQLEHDTQHYLNEKAFQEINHEQEMM